MGDRGGLPPFGRRIYYWGLGQQRVTDQGLWVWKSPTLNRKKTPTQRQIYAQGTFKVAAQLLKMCTAFEYQQCLEIAGQSGYTWKDQFYAMIYGVGVEFYDVNGVHWQGRRILAADIQQLLDSISSASGSILVRTPGGWATLLPGTPEYVLTMRGDTGLPDWQPNVGGGGGASLAPATIIQAKPIAIAAGTLSATFDAAPSVGNQVVFIALSWSNSPVTAPGWTVLATGPTSGVSHLVVYSKIVGDDDTVTMTPSSTSSGWGGMAFELDGGTSNLMQAIAQITDTASAARTLHLATPQDHTLLIGLFEAEQRSSAATITLSGAVPDDTWDATSTATTSGGFRTIKGFAFLDHVKDAIDLTANYSSSGANVAAWIILGPHVVP